MKLILVLTLLLTIDAVAQTNHPKAHQFDEFGEECVESVLARRDAFFYALGHSPGSRGLVIIYGIRELEGRNVKLEAYYSSWNALGQKRLETEIRVIRGVNLAALKVQFWIVPTGATDPQPESPYQIEAYGDTKLFDRSWADFHRWKGPLDIYSASFYDLGCDSSLNRGLLAKRLKENPSLSVHLIGYRGPETTMSRAKRVLIFAVNDLVKHYKIARKRITTSYGGKRAEPQIEVFLVPKGRRLPVPSVHPERGVR